MEMYEAAKIDGANVIQRFLYVTLPTVKTTVLVALLFRTLDAFRVFDLISVMTGGANGTESISVYAYNNLMKFLDFGYGSSLAVLIFVVVFIIRSFHEADGQPSDRTVGGGRFGKSRKNCKKSSIYHICSVFCRNYCSSVFLAVYDFH